MTQNLMIKTARFYKFNRVWQSSEPINGQTNSRPMYKEVVQSIKPKNSSTPTRRSLKNIGKRMIKKN